MLCQENLDLKRCSMANGLYLNCFSVFDYKFNEDFDYFSYYENRDEHCHFFEDTELIFEDPDSDHIVYFWIID